MRRPSLSLVAVASLVAATAVAAHAAAGGLDTTFSGDGKVTTQFGGFQQAEGVVVLADGRIVTVGTRERTDGTSQFALARHLPNGGLDTSFGGDGKVITSFIEGNSRAYDVAVTGSGDYLVAGLAGSPGRVAVARYDSDGALDATFSGDGRRIISFGEFYDRAESVAVTPAGRIVVVGYSTTIEGDSQIAVARLTSTGALDTSFSSDGKVLTPIMESSYGRDVAVVDGAVVVVGSGYTGDSWKFVVVRYTRAGELDAGFGGGDGWLTTRFATGPIAAARAYAVQVTPDGRLVVVGEANSYEAGATSDFALARYLPNGELDDSFGGDGRVVHDHGDEEKAGDAMLQPDGKIVVVGVSGTEGREYQAIMRLRAGGGRDLTFADEGVRLVDFGSAYEVQDARDVASDGDARIIVVGSGQDHDASPGQGLFTAVRVLGS